MIRTRGRIAALAAVAVLGLGACGGGDGGADAGAAGEPVSGGTADILLVSEPRSLDPAIMNNNWAFHAPVGNALYGTLMTNDRKTGELQFNLAESFETTDNGKTFELTLREGVTYSDGSAMTAADVKFSWDRAKDPATGSSAIREASLMESTEVVDERTVKLTLVKEIPEYGMALATGSMNWIAPADALKKGQEAFDKNPIGAGPFTLKSWTRQDKIELEKNPDYYDAPKPYLDSLTVRTTPDAAQRLNAVSGGTVDVAMESNAGNIATATDQGLQADVVELGGGQNFTMNSRKAPFDDVRARQAVAAALDMNAVNTAVYNGKAEVPTTLFPESSPFYSDVPLRTQDKTEAQRLFDELAAEGKPVNFTFTTYPSTEAKVAAESVQAQLSAFENVQVKVKTVDLSEVSAIYAKHDFEMVISSLMLVDPEPQMSQVFYGGSQANNSGIDDKQLNAALDKGRTSTDVEERRTAYQTAAERIAELQPMVFYIRPNPGVIAGDNVGGVTMYGLGSLLPAELWVEQ